jgi:tetratricopeptide (TPR) repeat protein
VIERAPADLSAADREAAVDRALAHYLTSGAQLARLLTPGREPSGPAYRSRPDAPADSVDTVAEAVAWLERNLPTVVAVAELVSTPAAPPHRALFALGMARALTRPLFKRGEWAAVHQLARLAVAGADRQPDPLDRADALRLLGQSEIHVNDDEAAAGHLTAALASVRAAGDVGRQIGTLTDLGIVAMRRGEYAVALGHTLEALELARGHGDRRAIGVTLLNLSSVYSSLTDWKRAQEALEESLAIRREFHDLAGLAIVLPSLGSAHFLQGHLDEAIAAFTEGLAVCEQVGNTFDGWMAAFGRGLVRVARGDCVGALHDARAAWACREGRPHEAAATLRLVARAVRRAGHPRIAETWDRRADAAYAELTVPVEEQIELMLAERPDRW